MFVRAWIPTFSLGNTATLRMTENTEFCFSNSEVKNLLLHFLISLLITKIPPCHRHSLKTWLKLLLVSICSLTTLTVCGLFYSRIKTGGLHFSTRMLEAVSQIMSQNRHRCKPHRELWLGFSNWWGLQRSRRPSFWGANKSLKPQATKMDSYIAIEIITVYVLKKK